MKGLVLSVLLMCACAILAYGQEQDSTVSESVQDTLEQAVQNTDVSEMVQENVQDTSKNEEPVVLSEPVKEVSQDTVKPVPTSEQQSGGLLDALYPVYPDEAIAAGHFQGGATLSLIQANTEDDAMNIILGDIYEGEGYMFTVELFGGYFIKDALAVGTHLGYSRTWFDIDFSLLEDIADVKQHRKYVSNGFFAQPFLKNYMKVLDSRNLYLFNETSVKVEYSYGISQSDDGEEMDKTRNKTWSIEAGINPGLCIMVLNRFAFETSVGLLGLSTSVIDVEENGESHSRLVFNMVNFTINLLALDFSLVYFI